MYIELSDKIGICLADIVHNIALVTVCRFHGLDPEDLMTDTLRRTSHVVQPVIELPSAISALRLTVAFKIVRINTFPMEKAKNPLESLLRAAHITLIKVISPNAVEIELAEGVSHMTRLNNPVLGVILSL